MSDPQYRTFPYKLTNGGVVARYQYDRMPPGTYRNLQNLECRQENMLSTRYGIGALSTAGGNNQPLIPGPVTSLSRMKGLSNPYNYGVSGGILYRRVGDAAASYASAATGLAGGRVSMYPYRPNASSQPWMFIADSGKLLKDNGTAAFNWGISPPVQPALIAPAISGLTDIELFDEGNTSSFTFANVTGTGIIGRLSDAMPLISSTGVNLVLFSVVNAATLSRTGGVTTANTGSPHNYVTGMRVNCIFVVGDQTFLTSSAVITVTSPTQFTYPNPGANSTATNGNFTAAPSYQVGMSVTTQDGGNSEIVYITEVTAAGWVATFTKTHAANTVVTDNYLAGSVAANTTGTVSKFASLDLTFTTLQEDPNNNIIQLYLLLDNPLAVKEVKVVFDVGDGSFSQDYYYKSMVMSAAQANAAGNIPGNSAQTGSVFLRAGGGIDPRTVGGSDPSILPSDLPLLQQMQPTAIDPGSNVWTLFTARIGEFVAVGAAGGPNNNWKNVVAWRVQVETQPNLTVAFGVDDLAFVGGSDLDSFGGQSYDYRYTYYNINTGDESSPSQIMVATDPTTFAAASLGFFGAFLPIPLAVQRSAIEIEMRQSSDTQVTHFRLYRRGGTLTQAWYRVAEIPGAFNASPSNVAYTDTIADATILVNDQLNINADPPVTSLLPQPLSTTLTIANIAPHGPGIFSQWTLTSGTLKPGQLVTVGDPNSQETVYVQNVVGSAVTLFLQLSHGTSIGGGLLSTPVQSNTSPSTPMNLMAIAFDKAWLAGDPNNPHVLYYSTTFQPETFPQQNSLEIGTPDAPIMALIEMNGLLFVFTTKRVYEILGAGSAVPTVIPTAVKHGLSAQFAWCAAENVIYYLSYDGIYAFSGGSSGYLSEPVEWIWTGKNLGPVPAIDTTQMANVFMAYANHEVFVAYTDQSAITHRLIYHDVYRRWRNDDYLSGNITAEYFAEDIGELIIAKSDNMVYQDRVNDLDNAGVAAGIPINNPIPFTLQTAQMDQSEVQADYAKRYKLYNNLTIDADLNSQTVNVSLIFDSGNTVLSLGTIVGNGSGRQQFQLNINSGDGYESLNVGLLITGQTEVVINFFEVHIRAAVQAEARRSWDTWWIGYGVDEWHLYKQIFAEYRSSAAAVTVLAFTDGNMAAPAFQFTLPQTPGTHRAAKKLRFPATKCRLIRFVGTSTADFFMYDDTQIEHKKLGSAKGYERGKISP